ncbi:DnaJ domain-containing protein [bacterium]|nr:DnaJ domain-containing protein [bacterium]
MRILFVSEHDRCRGPMVRALAERLARKANLDGVVFDSAGINTPGNETPTVEAATFLRNEKINILNHRSKPLSVEIADGADVVFCMTKSQTDETRRRLGDYYAPKVVLLNEGIDLATKKMDVDPPTGDSVAAYRRLYASLSAAMGRLVRTLEDPEVVPEYFGAKAVAPRMKAGTGGAGPRASAHTLDPEKRRFLANVIFDLLERSFEPHTTSLILDDLKTMGHEVPLFEVEEVMRQDLHGSIRQDKDGVWHVVAGAREQRREKAKAEARARAEKSGGAHHHKHHEKQPEKPRPARRLTEQEALEALGVTMATPHAEARSKYRALLKKYHPDKFHDDDEFRALAEEKAKRINEAWNMLKDRFASEDDPVVEV